LGVNVEGGFRRVVAALVLALASMPASSPAQSAEVAVERENFRAAPAGIVVAELVEGTPLTLGEARGRWREATLEAWIWAASVQPDTRDGHDLSVSTENGENLRETPNGRRLGRARPGMLLDRVAEDSRWIRVRRTAWIWGPSVRVTESAPAPTPAGSAPAGESVSREFAVASDAAVVREDPGADTLARVQPGARVEVLAREGDWTRVRIEGWMFTASLAGDSVATAVLGDSGWAAVREDPERYRGRLVEWTLQFIALEEAERFRTEFVEGEPFILARGPGEDAGFVYLAVPPDRMSEVSRLSPLARIRVLARIRAARSTLTGAPVLELLEITGRP
jgi:hypothetical protein